MSSLTDEAVDDLLDAGAELIRMIREGDTDSGNDTARDVYRRYFARTTGD